MWLRSRKWDKDILLGKGVEEYAANEEKQYELIKGLIYWAFSLSGDKYEASFHLISRRVPAISPIYLAI